MHGREDPGGTSEIDVPDRGNWSPGSGGANSPLTRENRSVPRHHHRVSTSSFRLFLAKCDRGTERRTGLFTPAGWIPVPVVGHHYPKPRHSVAPAQIRVNAIPRHQPFPDHRDQRLQKTPDALRHVLQLFEMGNGDVPVRRSGPLRFLPDASPSPTGDPESPPDFAEESQGIRNYVGSIHRMPAPPHPSRAHYHSGYVWKLQPLLDQGKRHGTNVGQGNLGNKTDGTPDTCRTGAESVSKEVSEKSSTMVNERDEVTGQQTRARVPSAEPPTPRRARC